MQQVCGQGAVEIANGGGGRDWPANGCIYEQVVDKALSRLFMGAVGAMGLASAANGCIYDVDGGKRAIMFNRFPNPLTGEGSGIQKHIINEGTHFKMPYFQEPKIFDVRAFFRLC